MTDNIYPLTEDNNPPLLDDAHWRCIKEAAWAETNANDRTLELAFMMGFDACKRYTTDTHEHLNDLMTAAIKRSREMRDNGTTL